MSLSSVLLPEPLAPMRPSVWDSSSSKPMLCRAQNSSVLGWRKLTSRSLSDLSWCSSNVFETSTARMTGSALRAPGRSCPGPWRTAAGDTQTRTVDTAITASSRQA